MNGFVFEFKEKCDTNFINNFKLIEKDEQEELQIFNYSQLHYRNLERPFTRESYFTKKIIELFI